MRKTRLRNDKGQFKKASKLSEYGFVNLSTYTSPVIKEVSGKEWIEYGADNNYFQVLLDRYNGSPTNNAAINGISQAIYGKGLNASDSNLKPLQYAQMISLFKKETVRRLCYDLKLMGQCAVQVIYSKNRKKIAQLAHMPIETLRAEKCDENGDVLAYYYFKDWANIKRSDTPLRIPAFGTSTADIEIMYIKPYKSGFYYYSPVDYQGGLQYAELEEEVSNYHLNNILNGLAPSMLINFNNGTPNQQERQLIETKIAQKFSGSSNAGKFILAFNDNKESQAEITPVQLSDAHNQYQFLSEESQSKIQVAHRVVSPFLLGIRTSSGFSSNADEIETASLLMDNTVIRPFQELLIDSFDQILAYNDIALKLYFTTLQPLEFTNVDKAIQGNEDIEEETGYEFNKTSLEKYPWDKCIADQTAKYGAEAAPKICGYIKSNMSAVDLKEIDGKQAYKTREQAEAIADLAGCKGSHEHKEEDGTIWYMPCENHDQANDKLEELTNQLISFGEDEEALLENYNLIDVSEVDYESEDHYDEVVTELNTPKQSTLNKIVNLISTGRSFPNRKSKQDGVTKQTGLQKFMVRYQYAPLKTGSDARKFCKAMVRAKRIYRKEDIERMSNQAVNPGFGVKGAATYSIWLGDDHANNCESDSYNLYKGGARCKHKWFRKTYMLTLDGDKSLVTSTKAKSLGFKFPINDQLVPVAPADMKYKGYTKAYWDKMQKAKTKRDNSASKMMDSIR